MLESAYFEVLVEDAGGVSRGSSVCRVAVGVGVREVVMRRDSSARDGGVEDGEKQKEKGYEARHVSGASGAVGSERGKGREVEGCGGCRGGKGRATEGLGDVVLLRAVAVVESELVGARCWAR